MPDDNRIVAPYGIGPSLPDAAYQDQHDKATPIDKIDGYEMWRDWIVAVNFSLATLNVSWLFKTYTTNGDLSHGIIFGIVIAATFITGAITIISTFDGGSPGTLKGKGLKRLAMWFLGLLASLILHSVLWS